MLVIQNEDTPACLGTKLRCSEQGVATLTVAPLFKEGEGGGIQRTRLARLGVGFCKFSDAHRTGSSDMLHCTLATADLSICHALQYLASPVQSVPTNAPHRTAGRAKRASAWANGDIRQAVGGSKSRQALLSLRWSGGEELQRLRHSSL